MSQKHECRNLKSKKKKYIYKKFNTFFKVKVKSSFLFFYFLFK